VEFFEEIEEVLQGFSPIGLEEMGASVRLMSRIDNKYVIPAKFLKDLLLQIKDKYFVFEINNKRAHEYKTLYYDTDDLLLYKRHHQGKLNRYKIRERSYVDSELSYFEIKFKNNKNDTIKNRIKISQINDKIEGDTKDFLRTISGLNGDEFRPKLWVLYHRITLVSKAMNERATIDLGLTFDNLNNRVDYSDLVVIEAKRDKTLKTTPILLALKENKLREGGFSKYCLGQASTNPNLKHNQFKKKFHQINQLRKRYDIQ
jgi:hypothetical protein